MQYETIPTKLINRACLEIVTKALVSIVIAQGDNIAAIHLEIQLVY